MNECFGKYYVRNGEFLPSDSFEETNVYEGESVYEVIRVMNGIPLFFNDHFSRLETSARLKGRKMLLDLDETCRQIVRIVRTNRKRDVNVKIVFNYTGDVSTSLIYCIKPLFPTEAQYRNGVRGILFNAMRNDPESKVINQKLRKDIYFSLLHARAYEAVLVNNEQRITEGSRSNIFFIKNGTLFTAPDSYVLLGITRKYVLEICRSESIPVSFECVNVDNLGAYDGAFMTGTSPMVLPFNSLGEFAFDASLPLVARLRRLYVYEAERSISRFIKDFPGSFGG
ncbi:MAG: aminotransferase class IV [Bacteroidales bacterium]|jgi:branched-chain amino acid aminotransferase|nr:aminotransferase class IV [Bacteroidales bacterium]